MPTRPTFVDAWRQRVHARTYLALQAMRGRPVGAHMRKLKRWERLSPEAYAVLCRQRLSEALAYAKARVRAYAAGEWRDARADDLTSWPVLTRAFAESYRTSLQAMSGRGLAYRQSSGSVRQPLRVAWDRPGIAWAWANEYQGLAWHGVPIAARTLMLWAREEPIVNRVLNRSFYNTACFKPEVLERAVQRLRRERPTLRWAKPSTAAQLARYVAQHHGDAPRPLVSVAKVGGEQTFPFQRREIEQYLGARVVDVYGCSELGTIAMERPHGSMHVFAPTVHIEIMRDNEPVRPGEWGDIVATSLINRAMPLVRYRNGDRARLLAEPCPCGLPHPVLADLQARDSDVLFTSDNRPVHASAIGEALNDYVGVPGLGTVRLLRFDQLDRRRWRVFAEVDAPPSETLREQATQLVRSIFGQDCEVEVRTVRWLEREPSGKFRYYRVMPADASAGVETASHAGHGVTVGRR